MNPKTLLDLTADLYARFESLQSSPHTLARLRSAMRLFLEYLADRHRVTTADMLTLAHIHAFQSHLSQRPTIKQGLPLKPSTINTIVKSVRAFLEMLHEYGYIHRALAKHLAYIREPQVLPRSVLTHVQVRALMRKINTGTPTGVRDRAIFELLYSSGMRIGELESLTFTDLDLEHATARVIGKGKKERFVPIGKTAMRWLTSYIRGIRPFLAQGGESTNAVFLTDQGAPLPQRAVRQRVREYAAHLGLDIHITPHTFRRSCTSEMIKSNANLYHVKQLLGHNSFETLNHYAKLDITDLQKTHARCHPRERDESQ
ncbi:MAG: tyrosine-type recombinase/integrase [Magnetococcus sp. WYHC-3]